MTPAIQSLLDDLKHEDELVRDRATVALWHHWFHEKGVTGLAVLQRSQQQLDAEDFEAAELTLSELIADLPDFAEAWNRRATLRYLQSRYRQSLYDCQVVVRLVPYHFGALHGMGLCHAALGEFREAIQAFSLALDVQPHAQINRILMLECTARLS
jgi:tetratricopeptide (TPR) repeat protein